jgi:hypothetical protein
VRSQPRHALPPPPARKQILTALGALIAAAAAIGWAPLLSLIMAWRGGR